MNERTKAIITIIVTAAVNIANVCGYAANAEMWVNAVLTIASAVCIAWSWWKNQNVTEEAIMAQAYLNDLKAGRKEG